MGRIVLAAALAAFATTAGAAQSGDWYEGKTADDFIAKHFPKAEIPGQFEGYFREGRRRHWATCYVPAMGARSDGAVSACYAK